jgi:hypothetical protein
MVCKIRGRSSHILDLGTTQCVGVWSVLRSAAQATEEKPLVLIVWEYGFIREAVWGGDNSEIPPSSYIL